MTDHDPARSLSEILDELTRITGVQHGEAAAMRAAVGELSGALAHLFELIRSDRAQSRATIADLEAALAEAHTRIRQLEAGEQLPVPAPPPNDFGQLRDAAERLRVRTEQLFRDAGTPADAGEVAAPGRLPGEDVPDHELTESERAAQEARIEAARRAVERSLAEDATEDADPPAEPEEPVRAVLRVFPGSTSVAAEAVPDAEVEPEPETDADVEAAEAVAVAVPVPEPQPEPAASPPTPAARRNDPVVVGPRAARRRRGLRRRKVDARKLTGVEPTSALRAMVGAVDQLWTSGNPVDLVIALTDGGALHVTGGDTSPLTIRDVEHGTAARSTVTATTDQLLPLFGRLELTGDESAPLIHGSRRDADLLVGWIDRAQKLAAEPL